MAVTHDTMPCCLKLADFVFFVTEEQWRRSVVKIGGGANSFLRPSFSPSFILPLLFPSPPLRNRAP